LLDRKSHFLILAVRARGIALEILQWIESTYEFIFLVVASNERSLVMFDFENLCIYLVINLLVYLILLFVPFSFAYHHYQSKEGTRQIAFTVQRAKRCLCVVKHDELKCWYG
jgi:hypothetical protein